MAGATPEGEGLPLCPYLDATTYLKVRWGASVSSLALLACAGVDEEGFREVLAVEEVAGYVGQQWSLNQGKHDRRQPAGGPGHVRPQARGEPDVGLPRVHERLPPLVPLLARAGERLPRPHDGTRRCPGHPESRSWERLPGRDRPSAGHRTLQIRSSRPRSLSPPGRGL